MYYEKIDISEGINVNKTSELKECDICHCWYFLDKGSKSQLDVRNGCHDVLMMSINLSDIAIIKVYTADFSYAISGISKIEAINLMQNIDLAEKIGTLKT